MNLYLNYKGNISYKWDDKTLKKGLPYTIYRQNIRPHWSTEWTPLFQNVVEMLENKAYLEWYYLRNKRQTQIHIIIIGVGVWQLYPQNVGPESPAMSVDETYALIPEWIENFMKYLYDNYYDRNNPLAIERHKRMHIIVRTQPGLAIQRDRYNFMQLDFSNLTKWWNLHLIRYAEQYGIPIFDAYHWSSYQYGYHIDLNNDRMNEELYDQLDHLNCVFCVNGSNWEWGAKYRHQCVECVDGNCVHMRANGRMILLQQILNAINILAHKQINVSDQHTPTDSYKY